MEQIENTNAQVQELLQTLYTMCITYGPQVVLVIVTLIVGLWIINKFTQTLKHTETFLGL
jgi:small conductance mechanosensitive channel